MQLHPTQGLTISYPQQNCTKARFWEAEDRDLGRNFCFWTQSPICGRGERPERIPLHGSASLGHLPLRPLGLVSSIWVGVEKPVSSTPEASWSEGPVVFGLGSQTDPLWGEAVARSSGGSSVDHRPQGTPVEFPSQRQGGGQG